MPSFGPATLSPTASTTDEDISRLSGELPGQLDDVLQAPEGMMRAITRFWTGAFTAITAVKIRRAREELAHFRAAFSTTFDYEKSIPTNWVFTGKLKMLVTTGVGPSIQVYIEYQDLPLG